MTKSTKYSVKEALAIMLEMPDGSESDDPELCGGDGDIEDESVKKSSLSDSYSPITDNTVGSIPSSAYWVGLSSGRGLPYSKTALLSAHLHIININDMQNRMICISRLERQLHTLSNAILF